MLTTVTQTMKMRNEGSFRSFSAEAAPWVFVQGRPHQCDRMAYRFWSCTLKRLLVWATLFEKCINKRLDIATAFTAGSLCEPTGMSVEPLHHMLNKSGEDWVDILG